MSGHSKLGPSSATRWLACPGSVALLDANPMPASEWAQAGTDFHAKCEDALVNGVNGVTDLAVIDYYQGVEVIESSFMGTLTIGIEQKVHLKALGIDGWGTVDYFAGADLERLHVVDVKSGHTLVSPANNKQMMYYALAILDTFTLSPSEVVIHIYQPTNEDSPWTSADITMAELRLYEQELIAGQERVRENPTMLVPGAEQCKYCCKHACPAIKSEVVKVEKAQLKPKDMSNEQMAKALEIEPLITGYYKDMKAVAKQRLLDNKSEGLGHKLVKQTGNRVWGKLDELKKFIDDNLIDAYEEKIKSPAVLEKLVKKDKVVFDELQKFMVKPDKGFKMVKEGTKGDAYTPDTFGAIK